VEKRNYIRIPHDRVGVLIGPEGRVKSRIEKTFNVTLVIDGESGNVEVVLNPDHGDVSIIFTVANIVKAIGRGFSPNRAMMLGTRTTTSPSLTSKSTLDLVATPRRG